MTKVTELAIRAKAAVQYPGWRLDITGPGTAVLTNVMGHRRMVTFRQRRKRRDGPIMRAAKWIVPATRCGWYMTTIPSLSMSKSKEVADDDRGCVPDMSVQEQMPGAEPDDAVPVIQKMDLRRVEPSEVQIIKKI